MKDKICCILPVYTRMMLYNTGIDYIFSRVDGEQRHVVGVKKLQDM